MRVDPVVFHVLATTKTTGVRFRLTEEAQNWCRALQLHAISWALQIATICSLRRR